MNVADDRLTLSLPSNPQYLCVLRAFCSSLLDTIGCHQAETEKVILAVHDGSVRVWRSAASSIRCGECPAAIPLDLAILAYLALPCIMLLCRLTRCRSRLVTAWRSIKT